MSSLPSSQTDQEGKYSKTFFGGPLRDQTQGFDGKGEEEYKMFNAFVPAGASMMGEDSRGLKIL